MNFYEMLSAAQTANDSLISVGLDKCVARTSFISQIAQVTSVCTINPSAYRKRLAVGLAQLRANIYSVRRQAPNLPIIFDAKYSGSLYANEENAEEAFDVLGVDAITVSPWMGKETLEPFLRRSDKGIFFVCKSSDEDPGSIQDQLMRVPGSAHCVPNWLYVAHRAATEFNHHGNCGVVIGATHPDALRLFRNTDGCGEITILSPGGGNHQGGNIRAAVEAGVNAQGAGLLMHFSSQIEDSESPGEIAEALRIETNQYRQRGKEAVR